MIKQITKRIMKDYIPVAVSEQKKEEKVMAKNNKKEKKEKEMTTEQIERAENLAQAMGQNPTVKVVKRDKGLIERVETEKVILTEDNRQILTD